MHTGPINKGANGMRIKVKRITPLQRDQFAYEFEKAWKQRAVIARFNYEEKMKTEARSEYEAQLV